MAKSDVVELVIEQILHYWSMQGKTGEQLERTKLMLHASEGAEIYRNWIELFPNRVDAFRRLNLPAHVQDADQLEMLIRAYSPKVRGDEP